MAAQHSYPFEMPALREGQRVSSDAYALSYVNPALAQITTNTIAGTASDGVYSFTISGTGNNAGMTPITISFTRGSSETNAQIATALYNAALASNALLGLCVVTNPSSGVVTLTFRRTTEQYIVTAVAPGSGTATIANTQTQGGTNIRVGSWVRRTSGLADDSAVVVASGASVGQFLGVVERTDFITNVESLNYDVQPPGSRMSVMRDGLVAVRVFEAVTPDSTPYVALTVTGAVEFAGQMGASNVGSGVDVSTRCRFITSASAYGLAIVELKK